MIHYLYMKIIYPFADVLQTLTQHQNALIFEIFALWPQLKWKLHHDLSPEGAPHIEPKVLHHHHIYHNTTNENKIWGMRWPPSMWLQHITTHPQWEILSSHQNDVSTMIMIILRTHHYGFYTLKMIISGAILNIKRPLTLATPKTDAYR